MSKVFALCFLFCLNASAAGQKVIYKIGAQNFEAYLATPNAAATKKSPGVLIVPDWLGPTDFTSKKADEMAKMGYIALVVDMYGQGVRPKSGEEAGPLAGGLKKDTKTLRERMTAAYDLLMKQKGLDVNKVVAFGYCFGGTSVLELGRSGAKLAGIASFHGGLSSLQPADAKNIKGRVLVMHGALDPMVPQGEVLAFLKEMNDAKVDYQMNVYANAVHAFAVPSAGSDVKSGAAYNPVAANRAWKDFEEFLHEVIH